MSREPGKRFARESRSVDGVDHDYEVRVDGDGKFSCRIGEWFAEDQALEVLRKKIWEEIERTCRLEFDPFIRVHYLPEGRRSRYENRVDEPDREEVELLVEAVWRSRTKTTRARRWREDEEVYSVADAEVDPRTAEVLPLDTRRRREAGWDDGEGLVPFTPERWRRLREILAAIRKVREKLAEVLSDASGARLDQADGLLLGPLPSGRPKPPPRRSRGRVRRPATDAPDAEDQAPEEDT
jgi:hypothetical protein